jgi:hypothetical protein
MRTRDARFDVGICVIGLLSLYGMLLFVLIAG